jgi:FkbH-like protein
LLWRRKRTYSLHIYFFVALSSIIARKLHAITRNLYKVIVLDSDQTLWKGICAEDGINKVEINSYRQTLQQFMLQQQQSGILLALCSKNQEEDVWAVFEKHPSMILKREHFVSYRINWQAKSENLQSLAQELNLSLESFIFIDDNPVECAEVRANCPEVLTLELPQNETEIPLYINHFWGFDRLKITEADQQRTVYYQQNQERQKWQKQALTFADFLDQLDLKVNIYPLKSEQIARVAQLTQRTNQFNFTTIKRTENEIKNLWKSKELECLVVEVKDRFGDYGLVGLMIFNIELESLNVDTFLLSCRALGKGVEHQMLAYLGNMSQNRGLNNVKLTYIPTDKNQPNQEFIDSIGTEFKQPIDQHWLFILPTDLVVKTKFITAKPVYKLVEFNPINPTTKLIPNYSFLFERIIKELSHPEQLREIIAVKNCRQNTEKTVFVKPSNPLEQKIANIWSQVLGLEKIGINDNFFELGGDSIKATIAVNQIEQVFPTKLPVSAIFQHPNIE